MVISGGFRDINSSRVPGITSDIYVPMNVRRGTVISAIV